MLTVDLARCELDERARGDAMRAIDRALSAGEMFFLTGHGVPSPVVTAMLDWSRWLFGLSDAEKDILRPVGPGLVGYRGVGTLRASTASAVNEKDPKEVFSIGAPDPRPAARLAYPEFYQPNVWPADATAMRSTFERCFAELAGLALRVGSLLGSALGWSADFFDARSLVQTSWLASINYPAIPMAADDRRFGQHRDRGCFTLLITTAPGLQVCGADGHWRPVPVRPDSFVVSIGSMLARWTDDRWIAPLHRVTTVLDANGAPIARETLAYFYSPDPGTVVYTEDGTERTVADHLGSMIGLYR